MAHGRPCGWNKGCSMSLLKTLKGQILLVSVGCLVAGLLALTVANYLTARTQAYDSLTAQ